MNLKILLGILGGLIIGAGAMYLSTKQWSSSNSAQLEQATTTEDTAAPSSEKTGASPSMVKKTAAAPTALPKNTNTFKNIFSQQGSHVCEFNQVVASAQNNYRIYIANGKMRGEFRTVAGGGTIMLYDGNYLYSWKEGATTGTRAPLVSLSQLPVAIPTDLTSGVAVGTTGNSVSWDCHTWILNPSFFVVPSYVKFTS